jgi:hypothetical protein
MAVGKTHCTPGERIVSGISSKAGNRNLWAAKAIIYVICEGKD